MKVRPMSFSDIPSCIEISQSVRQQTYNQHEQRFYSQELFQQELTLYSTETFSKFISESDKLALVAESDSEVAGLAIGKFAGAGLFDLSWICTSLNFQKQGTGRRIITEIETICLNKNCHKIFAYTFPWLTGTVNFYKACGFTQEALLKRHWHKLDFVMMSKLIA
jgi:ribosomal protein S18 acetylase RimI-like enzyme